MSKAQPKYKEGDRVLYKTKIEVIIIHATFFDVEKKTWWYKAISTESNEYVYIAEINLENQSL